jgi:hypothetical protein
MSNGYEAAKGQRNLLERLMAKIPGFRGFQDRELRRDVDKLLREHLAAELGRVKSALREQARRYTDAGQIAALGGFDRIDRTLDGLSQAVRFADYGATGFFDPVKIYDEELARLYEFDLSVLDDVAALDAALGQVPAPGAGDPGAALEALEQAVRAVDDKWKRRKEVVSNVVAVR